MTRTGFQVSRVRDVHVPHDATEQRALVELKEGGREEGRSECEEKGQEEWREREGAEKGGGGWGMLQNSEGSSILRAEERRTGGRERRGMLHGGRKREE